MALANIGLGVLVVVLITAFTAYFVAQEFAYTTVSRARLTARAEAGDAASARALDVTRRTSFMLSGAQLGITVTGLLAGYVAEPLIGTGLADLLGVASVPTAVGVAIGAAVSLIFCTFVQMLFGELFPKNLAIAMSGVGRPSAGGVHPTGICGCSAGSIWFFDQSSNLLLRAAAHRTGARRRAGGDSARSRAHRRRLSLASASCPRSCRRCSIGCSTSRPARPSTR